MSSMSYEQKTKDAWFETAHWISICMSSFINRKIDWELQLLLMIHKPDWLMGGS